MDGKTGQPNEFSLRSVHRCVILCRTTCVIVLLANDNSAFHPSGVGKWVPASAGKAKAGMVHSVSEWMQGVQVKLWDPLRTRAIPERLRGVFTTRRYTNPRLPLPLPYQDTFRQHLKTFIFVLYKRIQHIRGFMFIRITCSRAVKTTNTTHSSKCQSLLFACLLQRISITLLKKRLDPEAAAYEFYGWLMALYRWLAEQLTTGCG